MNNLSNRDDQDDSVDILHCKYLFLSFLNFFFIFKCFEVNQTLINLFFLINVVSEIERKHGAILIHLFGVVYTFILLTLICDKYFLPSVQCVCDDLSLPKVS